MEFRIELYMHGIVMAANHENLITDANRNFVYSYFDAALLRMKCKLLQIGGTGNHVHFLFDMSPDISLDELFKKLKLGSQTEMQLKGHANFFWDDGYYVYSIGAEDIEKETFGIMQQHLLHRNLSLAQELQKLREDLDMLETDELTDLNENSYN